MNDQINSTETTTLVYIIVVAFTPAQFHHQILTENCDNGFLKDHRRFSGCVDYLIRKYCAVLSKNPQIRQKLCSVLRIMKSRCRVAVLSVYSCTHYFPNTFQHADINLLFLLLIYPLFDKFIFSYIASNFMENVRNFFEILLDI